MDDETLYGMLMRKVQINSYMHMFVPVHLITGMLIAEDVFVDNLGKDYYIINPDKDIVCDIDIEEEYFIGTTISMKQLKNIYPNDILENAEMKFYNYARNNCIFSLYDENGNYKSMYLDINEVCNEYLKIIENKEKDVVFIPEEDMNDDNEQIHGLTKDEKVLILMQQDIDNFLKLLSNREYDKLIELLNKYKSEWFCNDDATLENVNDNTNDNKTPVIVPEKTDIEDKLDVRDFYEKTKKRIIGQDEAIKDVISAVKMDQYAKTPSERSRCFIIGPTGTGKTEIVKCLGEYLDKPMLKVDTTQITVPGYVGSSLEEYLSRLVNIAGGDIKKAENGIITFDEIDKKCGGNDKLFGQGFLYTLLPFLDGTDYTINVNGSKRNFNTSNLTVFASGSFSEIIKDSTLVKHQIGFNTKQIDTNTQAHTLNADEVFKKSSMPEELIGRFPIVVQLNPHTEESLANILLESDISQLKAEKRKFECLGIDLNWEDKYIEAVAKEAIKLNIGARSLKKIVERSVKKLRWKILTNPNKYKNAILLEETVNDPKVYKLK